MKHTELLEMLPSLDVSLIAVYFHEGGGIIKTCFKLSGAQ